MNDHTAAISLVGLYLGQLTEQEREGVVAAAKAGAVRIAYEGWGGFLGLGKVVPPSDLQTGADDGRD